MHIEIKSHPYKRGSYSIFIEGEPWGELDPSIFGKNPQLPDCKSLEEFEESFEKIAFQNSYIYSLRRLAAMSYYSGHLQAKLIEKGVSPATAEAVINRCIEEGYINDQEWIASYVKGQVNKRNGPSAISAKLQAKGIPRSAFEAELKRLLPKEAQYSQIQALIESKYSRMNLKDYASRRKLIERLARKGFNISVINEVISEEYL